MKKNVYIIIIILIIIISAVIFYILNNNEKNTNIDVYQDNGVTVEEFFEDKIVPKNSYMLNTIYTGEVGNLQFYRFINHFVNYLPQLSNIDNTKEYFTENRYVILDNTGLDNEQEFSELVQYVKENAIVVSGYEEIKFDEEYYDKAENGLNLKLTIKYKEGKEISFKAFLSDKYVNPIIKFVKYQ